MLRGETAPAEPRQSPLVHTKHGQMVPYTEEEMLVRTKDYEIRKGVYDKTMKVHEDVFFEQNIIYLKPCHRARRWLYPLRAANRTS
jgi:hypothetical protein